MIGKNVFSTAYALHDGDYDYKNKRNNIIFMNERMVREVTNYNQILIIPNEFKGLYVLEKQ